MNHQQEGLLEQAWVLFYFPPTTHVVLTESKGLQNVLLGEEKKKKKKRIAALAQLIVSATYYVEPQIYSNLGRLL